MGSAATRFDGDINEVDIDLFTADENGDLVEFVGGVYGPETFDDVFTATFNDLKAGDYVAVLTLWELDGETWMILDDQTIFAPLSIVEVAPKPAPTPEKPADAVQTKSGELAKTGAGILPLLLLGAASLGGGFAIRRRNQ